MNGLGDHDHRRPAPQAVRLLDRRRRLRRRGARVRRPPRRDRGRGAARRGRRARSCCSCCPASPERSPRSSSRSSGATDRLRRARPRGHGVSTVGVAARGAAARRRCRGPSLSDVGPLLLAAVGITLVSLTDTIATASSFAARRGDEVDPNQEMIGIGAANIAAGLLPGLRGLDQRLADRGRRAVGRQEPGRPASSAPALVVVLLLFFNSLLADLPQSALAAVVIAAALSLVNLARAASLRAGAAVVVRALARRERSASSSSACCEGIVVAIVLAILLFFRRSWWPHGAVLGRVDGIEGWHSVDDLDGADRGARRARVPLGGAAVLRQRRRLPTADPPPRAGPRAARGS